LRREKNGDGERLRFYSGHDVTLERGRHARLSWPVSSTIARPVKVPYLIKAMAREVGQEYGHKLKKVRFY
jgi:hypothetical protein